MVSLLIALLLNTSIYANGVGDLEGRNFSTKQNRSIRFGKYLGSGQYGDIYNAAELKDGKWIHSGQVVKILDFHVEEKHAAEIVANYRSSQQLAAKHPGILLDSEYLETTGGEALLLMPMLQSTIDVELKSAHTPEERLLLAKEVLTLYIQVANLLLESGYSHGDISLNNVGRIADGNLRLFDFDTLQKTNKRSSLDLSPDAAPEVVGYHRPTNVGDIYSMGLALAQLFILEPTNRNTNKAESINNLIHLRDSVQDEKTQNELLAFKLLVAASLNENPKQRQQKLIDAIEKITADELLPSDLQSSLQTLETSVTTNLKKSGVIYSVVGFCKNIFSSKK